MRYSASEKFEIIELVEQSSLSIRRTLAPIGIPRSTLALEEPDLSPRELAVNFTDAKAALCQKPPFIGS